MRRLFIIIGAILTFASVHADEPDPRKEGTHYIEKIRNYSEGEFQLLPDWAYSSTIRENIEDHGTVFLVEFLWTMPVLPAEFDSIEELKSLLLDIESLEGIEYWSGGRGKMHPYIRRSYPVAESKSRAAIDLPEWPQGTESIQFIQLQKDTSFGTNWYQMEMSTDGEVVALKTLNLTELKAITKKTSEAEGVLLQMAVKPERDATYMYCTVALREFPPIGWSQRGIAGSFNHRISALQAWFADRVFGKE